MALMLASIVLLLFCSVCSSQLKLEAGFDLENPEQEWNRLAALTEPIEERAVEPRLLKSSSGVAPIPGQRKVPASVFVSLTDDPRVFMKPERNARPLPPQVMNVLQKSAPSVTIGPVRPQLVELLCHLDRIYVRALKSYFFTRDAYKHLKFGKCLVNAASKKHYYLLYALAQDCGFITQSDKDFRSIKNVLSYKPTGPVLREMPFIIPMQCKYHRYVHSYTVGFYPKLLGGTVFRALSSGFTLTSIDASGNEISGIKIYTLTQPMYFEASQKSSGGTNSGDKRVYINKCQVTTSQDPNSTPKYTVIDGQGCMLDSKFSHQSKFLTGTSKMAPRIRVGAMMFNNGASTLSSQQLYMHCDISVGSVTPSPSSKACTYDPSTKRWKELYGDDSVCTCCPNCPLPRTPRTMLSSDSWLVSDVDELPTNSDSWSPSHKDLKTLDD